MALIHYTIRVCSNDGSTSLEYVSVLGSIIVNETGFTNSLGTYTYNGDKEFIGLATSANATEPTYAIGDSFTVNSSITLYIVEEKKTNGEIFKEKMDALAISIVNKSGSSGKKNLDELKTLVDDELVKPTGTFDITENRTYDVTNYASANVNIPEGVPIEVATEEEMNALLETAEAGTIYKYMGTTGTYENGALYVVENNESKGYSVTINLTNPSSNGGFGGVELYDDYVLGDVDGEHSYAGNLIGSITSANGSATVTTTTGKLFCRIWCNHSGYARLFDELPATTGNINQIGFSVSSATTFTTYEDGYGIPFTVLSDGTITIAHIDWDF